MWRWIVVFGALSCTPTPIEPPPTPAPQRIGLSQIAEVTASSQLVFKDTTYSANHAVDGDSATAWCEAAEGVGKGEWLEIRLAKQITLGEVSVQAGFYKSDRTLLDNGRPLKLRVTSDQGFEHEALVPPIGQRKYAASKPVVRETVVGSPGKASSLRIEIIDAEPGKWSKDTCISEVTIHADEASSG